MSRLVALAVMLGTAALGACGGGDTIVSSPPPPLPVPNTLAVVAGDSQSTNVGRYLAQPLVVSVATRSGIGLPGVAVRWAVTTGGGKVSASSVLTDAQGLASVYWTLGPVLGAQSVGAAVTGLTGSPANFSAMATHAPIVLHYDGTGWNTSLEDVNGASVSLASVWGATASFVLAVGSSCGNPLTLRFDGTGWGAPPPSCSGDFFGGFTSVWGSSASDAFASERNGIPPKLGGSILHFDGQTWTWGYFAPCPNGILCPGFQAVWSSSPTDAFAVGDGGLIAHYDGTGWNPQASGTTNALRAVWGVGPAGAVFAVGTAGTILYYDRSTWRAQTSGTTQQLNAVWGTSANDVFAVGAGGTVLHYDGTAWTAQSSGSTASLYGVWGTSGNAVFAVGDASTILHYDGTKWSAQATTASMNLRGIWGSSPANVFAVGSPR
jgi:hypothetical protein